MPEAQCTGHFTYPSLVCGIDEDMVSWKWTSYSWWIHGLGYPWIGLTSVCGSGWRRNLSVNAICEIPTTILDDREQLLTKIWLVGNDKIHGRGGIIFMTDPWFRPPIDWVYIDLWFRLTVQSIGKCYLWDPHHNFGWQGAIIDKDMVSWKQWNSWKGRHHFHDRSMV